MWFSTVAGTLSGAIDGGNCAFSASMPVRPDAQVFVNGLVRLSAPAQENGYDWLGATLQLREAPVPGDVVAVWQPDSVSAGGTTNINGPRPPAGDASSLSPTLSGSGVIPSGTIWALPQGTAAILRP